MSPEHILQMIAARRDGWTLERDFYTSPEIHEMDVEHVYAKSWLYAGHASRIPSPGEYFLYSIAGESLIIIRGEDGKVRALVNVCRHRGSAICTEASGCRTRLVCPYHQWVYKADGSLVSARLMPPDFDKSSFGLHQAQAREVEGLIFVHLTDGCPDFAPFERDITARLQMQGVAGAKVAYMESYEIQSNWKLVLENSRECYHCGKGHPQYCKAVEFAAAIDNPSMAGRMRAESAEREARLREIGVETPPLASYPGSWYHSRRFFLRPGFVSQSMDGRPVAPLMGTYPQYDVGVLAVVMMPSLMFEASADYVMITRFTPISPLQCHAQVEWLVRGGAVEGRDYDVERLIRFWQLTSEQDWELCANNQKGVNSRFYEPSPYAPQENGVKHFANWYLNKLTAGINGHI